MKDGSSTKPVLDRIDYIHKLAQEKLRSSIFNTLKMEATNIKTWQNAAMFLLMKTICVYMLLTEKDEYEISDFNCDNWQFQVGCVISFENTILCFLQN